MFVSRKKEERIRSPVWLSILFIVHRPVSSGIYSFLRNEEERIPLTFHPSDTARVLRRDDVPLHPSGTFGRDDIPCPLWEPSPAGTMSAGMICFAKDGNLRNIYGVIRTHVHSRVKSLVYCEKKAR